MVIVHAPATGDSNVVNNFCDSALFSSGYFRPSGLYNVAVKLEDSPL